MAGCDCEVFQGCSECAPKLRAVPKPGLKKKKTKKTKEEADHLNKVASLGCIICKAEACVHHIRVSGEPRNHMRTIPLCWDHHQGPNGIHTMGKRVWWKLYGHELELLELVLTKINRRKNGRRR